MTIIFCKYRNNDSSFLHIRGKLEEKEVPTSPVISSSISQGHFHFAKGTWIVKSLSQFETFEGAPRPRHGATEAMASCACGRRVIPGLSHSSSTDFLIVPCYFMLSVHFSFPKHMAFLFQLLVFHFLCVC